MKTKMKTVDQVNEALNQNGLKCPVCLDLYTDAHLLQTCSHTFCKRCVLPHLLEVPARCPLCHISARRADLVANPVVTQAATAVIMIITFDTSAYFSSWGLTFSLRNRGLTHSPSSITLYGRGSYDNTYSLMVLLNPWEFSHDTGEI
jgi:hypothetical protein